MTSCEAWLLCGFQHTAARRRLGRRLRLLSGANSFQHTAARRRLDDSHSGRANAFRFNTQPPEGGWYFYSIEYIVA